MARRGDRLGPIGVSIAAAGVLIGHWLTYGIEVPRAAARAQLLAATGHSYLHLANDAGLALAVAALAGLVLAELTETARRSSFRSLAAGLAFVQTVAFAVMEIAERVTSRVPLSSLLRGGLIFVGLAVQILVALVLAGFLRWLQRATSRLRTAFAAPRHLRRATLARQVREVVLPITSPEKTPGAARAPPVSA